MALSLYLGVLISFASIVSVRSTTTGQPTLQMMGVTQATNATTVTYPPLHDFNFEVQCKFQPDSYKCEKAVQKRLTRWYFDIKMGDCKPFTYYRCYSGNKNIFKSYDKCRQSCRDPGPHAITHNLPANAACIMQPAFGECSDYIPIRLVTPERHRLWWLKRPMRDRHGLYYYDVSTKKCLGFAYSGCGGNQNRFYNDKVCAKICLGAVENIVIPSSYYIRRFGNS